MIARVETALGGQAPDRLDGLLHRDGHEPLGGGLGALGAHGLGEGGEP